MNLNRQLPRVDASRFSMVPKAEIPRSTFTTTHAHKSTFNAALLIPVFVDEVLPGDVHKGQMTVFARTATPLFPIMDNMELESFFFFVPARIVWQNWTAMMGERASPTDSISFVVPTIQSPIGGFAACSIYDYMGIPGIGQIDPAGSTITNALPLRAYNRIWNEWFRDENLQAHVANNIGDGPDANTDYVLLRRGKKHDYFTSALPWPLKGGQDVTMPLSGQAPVLGLGVENSTTHAFGVNILTTEGPKPWAFGAGYDLPVGQRLYFQQNAAGTPQIYADLSQATGATINALRIAFQTQRLLERDARGGTRYTELLQAHFGVTPEDARLQRPEYIGGGKSSVQTSAVPQTSATGLTGGSSPLGALGATSTVSGQHSFSYHATEHGYIIGLVNVRNEITYQQGLKRLWTRQTRYDFYWPVFANLGEQAIRNDEIAVQGNGNDTLTFGYQERWAEYRHRPSQITAMFRSTTALNIDEWHLAEQFSGVPALNASFITDKSDVTLTRALAAGSAAANMQILFDSVFRIESTRPMPMYSVPGMIDHF